MNRKTVLLTLLIMICLAALFAGSGPARATDLLGPDMPSVSAAEFETKSSVFLSDFQSFFATANARRGDYGGENDWLHSFDPAKNMFNGNIYAPMNIGDDFYMLGFGTFSFMGMIPVMFAKWNAATQSIEYYEEAPLMRWGNTQPEPKSKPLFFVEPRRVFIDLILKPLTIRNEERSLSTEAQTALSTIRKVVDVYLQTNGSTGGLTMELIEREARLGENTLRNWIFSVEGNPPHKYIATSTATMPAGSGKKVWYDAYEAMFHGFGVDDE